MIYPIRTIVAGIADPTGPDPVLSTALDLAGRTGATVHLVHAFDFPVWMETPPGMGYAEAKLLQEYIEGVQTGMEEHVRRLTDNPRVLCRSLVGLAAATILDLAEVENADLVLVGATRARGLSRRLLGSTAERVLRKAAAPVLILKGPLPDRLQRVLLATDLSEFSAGITEAALDVLETLFGGDRSERRSLFVLEQPTDLPESLQRLLMERTFVPEHDRFIAARRRRAGEITGRVRVGEPAAEILEETEQWHADLVVIGTHGRSGRLRWVLGSVAESVVRNTTTHVLLIPAPVEAGRRLPVVRTGSTSIVAAAI